MRCGTERGVDRGERSAVALSKKLPLTTASRAAARETRRRRRRRRRPRTAVEACGTRRGSARPRAPARLPARRGGLRERPVHSLALRPRVGENAGGRVADAKDVTFIIFPPPPSPPPRAREQVQIPRRRFVRLVPEVRCRALVHVGVRFELRVERLPAALPRAHHVVVRQTPPARGGVVREARRTLALLPRARPRRQRGEQVRVQRFQQRALAARQRHGGAGLGGLGRDVRARGRGREARRMLRRGRHDHGRRFGSRERLSLRRSPGTGVEERGGEHHDQRRDDGHRERRPRRRPCARVRPRSRGHVPRATCASHWPDEAKTPLGNEWCESDDEALR